MTKKLRARQAALEQQGLFATDMNEKHRTFDALSIDGGYSYLLTKPLERALRAVVLSVVRVLGPENLRAVRGGAVSVCNHVHTLDTLMVKNALGPFRTFHTGSYYLLKKGVLGRIFKAGGFLPVGTRFSDIKNLQDAVGELVAQGKIVNFYPEHALWPQYERLRPFQQGAFRYAVKFDVPVLPLFIEFRETKWRKFFHMKKKVIVHILPAVYPSSAEGETAVFEAMRATGNRLYGQEVRAADYVPAQPSESAVAASGKKARSKRAVRAAAERKPERAAYAEEETALTENV